MTRFLLLASALLLAIGCGGAGKKRGTDDSEIPVEETRLDADDVAPRPTLASSVLTTAVDEKRYRAAGPAATEFEPEEPVIYLVGKLKHVPTQARIEVRWFREADPNPILISDIHGSDNFDFISSLSPARKEFIPGPYNARVLVDDVDLGGVEFRILGIDPAVAGPGFGKLKISTKVTRKMKPKSPSRVFKAGTKKLHATFQVRDAAPGTVVNVIWKRNDAVFHEEELEVEATGRFGAQIRSDSGLPAGAYLVVLEHDGLKVSKRKFTVGDAGGGPTVDRLAFGTELGADNLPTTERTSFPVGAAAVLCGLRFLDLPPDSLIVIQWTRVEEDGESVYHTTQTAVPSGGSGTMGAAWNLGSGIEPGEYKAVVLVGEEVLAEQTFMIE